MLALLTFFVIAFGFPDPPYSDYYKPYCNSNPETNAITPLTNIELDAIERLEQVHAIFRHGSRMIYQDFPCLGIYDDTLKFNCSLKEVLGSNVAATIELTYNQPNVWEGNCALSQLFQFGAEQEEWNGEHLREAFVGGGKGQLWDTLPPVKDNVYLYTTDNERTKVSLLHVLNGLYDKKLTTTRLATDTRDNQNDPWRMKRNLCQRVEEIENSLTEPILAAHERIPEYVEMTKKFQKSFNATYRTDYGTWDCLMVAACTGTPLPEPLTDLESQFFIDATSYGFHTSSSIFKRILTDPFAADMVNYVREKWEEYLSNGKPRMALWSGHDNTVAPFLTSLDMFDGFFPTYATLVTFEIYLMKNTDELGNKVYAFRVTRNGKVVSGSSAFSTNKVGSLIPLNLLWSRFPDFTDWDTFCGSESLIRLSNEQLDLQLKLPIDRHLGRIVKIDFWLLLSIPLISVCVVVLIILLCFRCGVRDKVRSALNWRSLVARYN